MQLNPAKSINKMRVVTFIYYNIIAYLHKEGFSWPSYHEKGTT